MPVIHIPFNKCLTSVSVTRGSAVSVNRATKPSATASKPLPTERPQVDELALTAKRTLEAIHQNLSVLDQRVQDEIDSVGARVLAVATKIAKEALNSDDTLIEERVSHFASVLIGQLKPNQSAVLFVNPVCANYLYQWMSDSDHAEIEIQSDSTVQPGDCRIELDDKGFLASLDAFLDAAAKQAPVAQGGI